MKRSYVSILLALLGIITSGAGHIDAVPLGFASYRFDPVASGLPDLPENLKIAEYPPGMGGYYIVQFDGAVTQEMRDSLTGTGARIMGYVPDFAFIIRASAAQVAAVKELAGIVFVGIFQPAFKLLRAASCSTACLSS